MCFETSSPLTPLKIKKKTKKLIEFSDSRMEKPKLMYEFKQNKKKL